MIWLELRVSQGHDLQSDEEVLMANRIEEAIDVPARRVFCDAERNGMWCYIRFDRDRLPMGRLNFIRHEIRRVFQNDPGRSFDELNVVTEGEVRERVPEAVG